MARMQVNWLGYALGAEVTGLDLSRPLDAVTVAALRSAWLDHLVLSFPNQDLTAEQLAAFARQFGELDKNEQAPDRGRNQVHPNVIVNTNKPLDGKPWDGVKVGGFWHTDRSFTQRPAIGTCLLSKAIPDVGGDTLFANQYLAYEALSPALCRLLEGLNAVHDAGKAMYEKSGPAEGRYAKPAVHPIVKVHSETGRKALYVWERVYQIEGMTEEESKPILDYLKRHAVRYEFTYRHRWRTNELLMWDNRCILHHAVSDYDLHRDPRTMLRCSLQGDAWTHAPSPEDALAAGARSA